MPPFPSFTASQWCFQHYICKYLRLHVSFPRTLGLVPHSSFCLTRTQFRSLQDTVAVVVMWFLPLQFVYFHSVAPDYKGNVNIRGACRRCRKVIVFGFILDFTPESVPLRGRCGFDPLLTVVPCSTRIAFQGRAVWLQKSRAEAALCTPLAPPTPTAFGGSFRSFWLRCVLLCYGERADWLSDLTICVTTIALLFPWLLCR